MTKRFLSKWLVILSVVCLILGFSYDFLFVLVASICILVAAALQFPFREEEGWECSCGYDLSFMNVKSNRCPECGNIAKLEWSSTQGELSTATTKRLHLTVLMFIFSFVLLLLFIAGVVLAKMAIV